MTKKTITGTVQGDHVRRRYDDRRAEEESAGRRHVTKKVPSYKSTRDTIRDPLHTAQRASIQGDSVIESKVSWCWRVRFYFKVRHGAHLNTHESSCDGAFPVGTTALQAITEVAKWRGVNLDTVYSIEAERLLTDPNTES